MTKVHVILPAFNEQNALQILVPKIDAVMRDLGRPYRVVAVDDGSTDGTAMVLQGLSTSYPIEVITHRINRGLGETIRDGFEFVAESAARDDVIIRLDSDDTHDPAFMASLLTRLDDGYDVVGTSRFQPGGGQTGVSFRRAFISRCANLFMRVFFHMPGIKDYSCGFRAYRASVVQDALRIFKNDFIQLRGVGFTCTLEKLAKLHLMGCHFSEVPFILHYGQKASESKMVTSVTTVGYFLLLFLYRCPFYGWRTQFRRLADRYRAERESSARSIPLRDGRDLVVPSQSSL
ncbi:MAG: glycosyltransferase [Planctomycetes bacterium]|nr:glycosyltransferase [Planctomycetota bacterium]